MCDIFVIERREESPILRRLLKQHAVVAIVGARQVGKTSLVRMLLDDWPGRTHVFDLENPEDLARIADPRLALKNLTGLKLNAIRYPGLNAKSRAFNPGLWDGTPSALNPALGLQLSGFRK